MHQPKRLWQPDAGTIQNAHLTRFMQWLAEKKGLPFADYQALWQWSTDDPAAFWECVWQFFDIIAHAPYKQALSGMDMPGARWFEGATLNYAEHVFRHQTDARPAILYMDEHNGLTEMSWAALAQQTAAFARFLQEKGVQKGDRVVAYLPNCPQAVVAVLAVMSIGAVWSSCSPDFGANSVADRWGQIEPRLLIAVDGYRYNGKSFDKRETLAQLCRALPGLESVVLIPFLHSAPDVSAIADLLPVVLWEQAIADQGAPLAFSAVAFDHPLWILFSSGTTGIPKAITHSHGGNLLEHLKYLYFHNDIQAGERFFWFSTTGWMMWNFTVGALLAEATIVLYDGSPAFPDLNVLWRLSEQARINHFGTSAPFIISCMKAGITPGQSFDLSTLRTIGSTGSPLPPEAFGWVYAHIKEDVWLSSMAGGTDVCTAWVGGNPLLPVFQGEIQCRCLGCAMESWDEDGKPVPTGEVGEMVVTRPMPSMPVFFWNDPDGHKYRSSYFDHYPGVWRHGDWLCITESGSLIILGRSDATLNRQGVRIGTAEIYRAVDQVPGIRDALIVNIEYPDGSDWMPMFVSLAPGVVLDDALRQHIKTTLRQAYSPRHVPDVIIEAPDIPYTISGKKMEMPVKKLLQGKPAAECYHADAMRNPEVMAFYERMKKG